VGAGEHDLDGEASLIGVAGAQGFERLDRGNEAAPVVLGIVDDGRRQGIAEFGMVSCLARVQRPDIGAAPG
jgi:hypothetical protein